MKEKVNSMLLSMLLVVTLSIFSFGFSSSKVFADGDETLGAPIGITIASGTGIVAAGTGLNTSQPGTITIDVPTGAEIKQVLLYWSGLFNSNDDNTILVNDTVDVVGTKIGQGPLRAVYRADITSLELVSAGLNFLSVEGLEFDISNDGAGLFVIYDDGSGIDIIDIRDGKDFAYLFSSPPFNETVPQTFTFPSSDTVRPAKLAMFFASVSGTRSGGGFRPSAIDVTTNGSTTVFNNLLNSNDGEEWDTLNLDVFIPAGATSLTVQAFSVDNLDIGGDPASFSWLTTGLFIEDGHGCTPGYWRQEQHFDSWTAPLVPTTLFSDVFCDEVITIRGNRNDGLDLGQTDRVDPTLLEAVWARGGGINALARHAVAALLNASANIGYPLSVDDVKALVCGALAEGTRSAYNEAKDILAEFNELGCPLGNGREADIGSTSDPVPDIKANVADGSINLGTSDTLSVSISITAGDNMGVNCDWWIIASTPFGWYYFDIGTMSWVYAGGSFTDISVTYQGPLFDLNSYEILKISGLPEGIYNFYFGVDTNMDGSLDFDELFLDGVVVN